ncbi:DUF1036 domain-containing protein [Roseospira navarrensis]|nr:DUF1036 domain-containing protein [Roseospira navarrensis]
MAQVSIPFRLPLGPRLTAVLLAPVALMVFAVSPALAGLEVCNQTNIPRWVAVGYNKDSMWTSEGWWNLEPGDCTTVLDGDLTEQFYYYRAEDQNEDFEGDGYMFCGVDDAFTIVGDQDCEGRGYNELGFREVDTGGSTTTFTLVLSPATVPGAQPIGTPPPADLTASDGGLEICNQTSVVRWVAIGYSKDDLWTSEGWWQVEPGDCALVLDEELAQRYYYYRAEDPDERFQGDGYMFCTVDDAFTIVGDHDCAGRGYEEVAFRELDTGETATFYSFDLNPATVPGASPIGGATSPMPAPDQPMNQMPPPVDERQAAVPTQPPTQTMPGQPSGQPPAQQPPSAADMASPFGAPSAALPSDESLSSLYRAVTGTWRSVDDPAASIALRDDVYTAFQGGTRQGAGSFEVSNACPLRGVDSGGDPVIVVRMAQDPEPACFSVLYVDATSLELISLPRGNLLRYRAEAN